jgi:uncharacterized membrane protein YcaP (DUF421 family)
MLILVIRTLILYGTVIISLRIMGKRQLGELQPSELVVAIMISDLASVPMQAIDIPILSGIIPVLTLIVAEVLMSYMSLKSKRIRKFLSGEPSIVIYDGRINEKELAKLRFNVDDLLEELRLNNCHDISDVAVAVIETSGKLSVIPKDKARGVTVEDMNIKNPRHEGLPYTLISDGTINREELKRSGKSIEWLKSELEKRGINSIRRVFIASLDAEDELYIQEKSKT